EPGLDLGRRDIDFSFFFLFVCWRLEGISCFRQSFYIFFFIFSQSPFFRNFFFFFFSLQLLPGKKKKMKTPPNLQPPRCNAMHRRSTLPALCVSCVSLRPFYPTLSTHLRYPTYIDLPAQRTSM